MAITIEKQIVCHSLASFRQVLQQLDKAGYRDHLSTLVTYGMSEYNCQRGMRVINTYSDKSVKYAAGGKQLINPIRLPT